MTKGGKNLVILGVASILIALLTVSGSLAIYHISGDIYLDRSRPGYLPDEEEEENVEVDYDFTKNGPISKEILEGYIDNLKIEIQALDAYGNPFDSNALSDERLGI